MNVQSEGLMYLGGGNGPLCPRSGGALADPMHVLSVRHQDAAYAAAAKNAEGEIADEAVGEVVSAIGTAWGTTSWMRLFRCTSQVFMPGPKIVDVEAWYYQCAVCGFILPATRCPAG